MSRKRSHEDQFLVKASDNDNPETPKTKRSKHSRKPSEPKQKASVKTLAVDPTSSTAGSDVEPRILQRIQKCLVRANHPGTPEAEAKAAFRMASVLMARHNVTQAEAFEQDDENDKSRLGGESVVTIVASKDDGKVLNYAFTGSLARAMNVFFDCRDFSTARRSSLEWTFYGISSNTAAAAMAFEMAYNLILTWSLSKKGVSVRHSYCLGVSEGLHKIARVEKRVERKKAKEREVAKLAETQKSEQAERQREIDRLHFQADDENDSSHHSCDSDDARDDNDDSPEPEDIPSHDPLDHEDSAVNNDELGFSTAPDFLDRDHETFDPLGDFETELRKARGSATAPPIKTWESETQLIMFRETAQEIAKDYLRQKDIKLTTRRKITAAKDHAAYKQGGKDSKKIDVRRKRLEAP